MLKMLALGLNFLTIYQLSAQEVNNPYLDDSLEELEALAGSILSAHCSSCHGGALARPRGDFGFVDDLDRLAQAEDYIVPGSPENSLLIDMVLQDIMPLGARVGTRPSLSLEDKQVLVAWVQSLKSKNINNERAFISERELANFIQENLLGLPPDKAARTRYLTLTHFYNLGTSREHIELFTTGLVKLINSLTWSEKGHIPKIIGQSQTILRINLDALGWSSRLWNRFVDRYPLQPFEIPSFSGFKRNESALFARGLVCI